MFKFFIITIKEFILKILNFIIFQNKKPLPKIKLDYNSKIDILIIVPQTYYSNSWESGTGNIFYEFTESCKDNFLNSNIELLVVESNKLFNNDILNKFKASKRTKLIFGFVEFGLSGDFRWEWYQFLQKNLLQDAYFVGIVLDSIHPLIRFKINLIQLKFDKSIFICIDQEINIRQIKALNAIGPCFLPISQSTLDKIEKWRNDVVDLEICDAINFSGKIYSSRRKLITEANLNGISLFINGRKELDFSHFVSYEVYMKNFIKFRYNLNFSDNSIYKIKQLKSRILECSLMGRPILTDEVNLISNFYNLDEDFYFFENLENIIETLKKINNSKFINQNLISKSINLAKFSLFDKVIFLINRF